VVALPFEAANVNASRKVPGPESALLVTINTVENAFVQLVIRRIRNNNRLHNMVQVPAMKIQFLVVKPSSLSGYGIVTEY